MSTLPLEGRVALITGASRGIGRAVALRLAGEGAHVIALARTTKDLETLDDDITELGGRSTLVPLDVADGVGIDRLAETLFERHGRLDVLVGNAAILGGLSPIGHISSNVWSRVIEVNLNANWRLIRSFDPLLRASNSGRALFVTSGVGHKVVPYWGPYAVSKAGLEMLVRIYAAETAKTMLRVNLINPRIVRTEMRAEAMPGEDPASLIPPEAITDVFVELSLPNCRHHGEVIEARVSV